VKENVKESGFVEKKLGSKIGREKSQGLREDFRNSGGGGVEPGKNCWVENGVGKT